MWFRVYDYPKFVNAEPLFSGPSGLWWGTKFNQMGFKTYRINLVLGPLAKRHWLDDHEFTFFVLRYS